MSSNDSARESPSALAYWVSDEGGRGAVLSTCMHHRLDQVCVDVAMCVMKSLPFVSISTYAPLAHRRASGAASGGALGRSAPPRAARAPPFSFLPNTEKLPYFRGTTSSLNFPQSDVQPKPAPNRRELLHVFDGFGNNRRGGLVLVHISYESAPRRKRAWGSGARVRVVLNIC
jgi:hypothetical protein